MRVRGTDGSSWVSEDVLYRISGNRPIDSWSHLHLLESRTLHLVLMRYTQHPSSSTLHSSD